MVRSFLELSVAAVFINSRWETGLETGGCDGRAYCRGVGEWVRWWPGGGGGRVKVSCVKDSG